MPSRLPAGWERYGCFCGVHPKIVSEMLGHATVGITVDVYSHVTPAMHGEAARVMDEVLGG